MPEFVDFAYWTLFELSLYQLGVRMRSCIGEAVLLPMLKKGVDIMMLYQSTREDRVAKEAES